MADQVKAIETEYAGHRFRSRLEARWAVFFDQLGVRWEYEPEGYETTGGRYLPDFWLPDAGISADGIWAEVKGDMSHQAMGKLMAAIPNLRSSPSNQLVPQLVVLGPIPRPGWAWTHARFDTIAKSVLFTNAYWHIMAERPQLWQIGQPIAFDMDMDWRGTDESLTLPFRRSAVTALHDDRLIVDPTVDAAYSAARSARFEHGESGPGF